MAQIKIGGDGYDVEILNGQSTPSTFSLHVQYESGRQSVTDVVEVDVEHRGDLTVNTVESILQEWADANDGKRITEFEFVEETPARRGDLITTKTDTEDEPTAPHQQTPDDESSRAERSSFGAASIQPVPGADPVEGTVGYEVGDRVAYRVGESQSSIYQHTTDGIVMGIPPFRRGTAGDPVHEHFLLDIGERRLKQVPVDRVVGHADDPDVTVDNSRELPELEADD